MLQQIKEFNYSQGAIIIQLGRIYDMLAALGIEGVDIDALIEYHEQGGLKCPSPAIRINNETNDSTG
jgi:hypothetical protein